MKCFLSKVCVFLIFLSKTAYAENFNVDYNVYVSGIKIGKFNWSLEIEENKYKTEINLENSGFVSAVYSFNGNYKSSGTFYNGKFQSSQYQQKWVTKKQKKIIEMSFDDYLIKLFQDPLEKEVARLNLYSLFQYCDPVTSFVNILNGESEAKTIDGRRVYVMKKVGTNKKGALTIEIKKYKNIWADHNKNDLKKIEFHLVEGNFLPESIKIYFKKRVFGLKKI